MMQMLMLIARVAILTVTKPTLIAMTRRDGHRMTVGCWPLTAVKGAG